MKTILILILLIASVFAQDTVWVETTFQKKARQSFEQIGKGYADEAENLRNAIRIIQRIQISQYHFTSLGDILNGTDESEIAITKSDRDSYLLKINERLTELKILYKKNQPFVELCEIDRKSSEFYILDKKLSEKRKYMTAEEVNALMLIKEGSPRGQYYDWQDWLFLTLSHRQPE